MGLYERLVIDESGIGNKYGDWTQVGASFRVRQHNAKQKDRLAVCQCKCGTFGLAMVNNLKRGISNGCPNCKRIKAGNSRRRHGLTESRVYETWCGIKKRCTNPNSKSWRNYGGRGIVMCDRWLNSFENFIEDMGQPPTDKHEIDRIDVQGNYEPGNCRWVTRTEQMRNTRKNVFVEYEGQSMTIAEVAERADVVYLTLWGLLRKGMTARAAVDEIRRRQRASVA